jgi:hypothetical protein
MSYKKSKIHWKEDQIGPLWGLGVIGKKEKKKD